MNANIHIHKEQYPYTKKLYYKRDTDKHVVMPRDIKTGVKVGDIIKFFGKLYTDKKCTNEAATTIIEYKILLVSLDGVLIETSNKYNFNEKYGDGMVHFIGKIFSPNFTIVNNVVASYTTEPAILLASKGTKHFQICYGYSDYIINGNGFGEIKLELDVIHKE